jgi:hypothetical protein
MKFAIKIVLVAILAYMFEQFLPWWSVAIAAFVVELAIGQDKGKAFLSGFLGIFLLWFIAALIIDNANEHILSTKMAAVLPLGGSAIAIILVTALIGGLVGGLAAASGIELKKALAE